MPDLYFPDISEFQPTANFQQLKSSGLQIISARTAYGSRIDRMMPNRRDEIRAANFDIVLWYVFMRSAQSIQEQFQTTTELLGSLRPNEVICVDWENDIGGSLPSYQNRDALLSMFSSWSGRPALLYTGAALARQYPLSSSLWVASYGTSEPTIQHVMWQYTNGKIKSKEYIPILWPSIGACDTSVFHGSIEDLKQKLGLQLQSKLVIGPIQHFGDNMTRTVFTIPRLDKDGNGWIDTGIPFEKVVNVLPFGPAPERDSYTWPNWYWSVNNTNGKCIIELEEAESFGTVQFAVWVVD